MSLYGVAEPIKLNRILHNLLISYQSPLGSYAIRKIDTFLQNVDFQNTGLVNPEYFVNAITSISGGGIGTTDANILINAYSNGGQKVNWKQFLTRFR